jgi:hypothetical protein
MKKPQKKRKKQKNGRYEPRSMQSIHDDSKKRIKRR